MSKLDDLKHKKRTVSDLIRLIQNKNKQEDTPNFSIFLGSGASKTSKIRTGEELTHEWQKKYYLETHSKEEQKCDNLEAKIEEYFASKEVPEWYRNSNPYSSLFEHNYDLQRQRRSFVEKEVDKRNPSLGYAYLVKLVDQNYFNTIFTTNFDDLLNESFYRFSKERPIVCAHDSSISSVMVTSHRSKIIKLHGDYLFENIKATRRETESLEDNMKMKFMEFAKDFGLIVIGYSGDDESIMDILFTLLERSEYFKNGIYWCIRKGCDINSEVKELLWRDKVFFIEIDGFDELMAEINDVINNGELPVDESFLSIKHQKEVVNNLIDNEYIKGTNSPILKRDCEHLSERFDKNLIKDFTDYMSSKNSDDGKNSAKRKRDEHAKIKIPKLSKPTPKEQAEISDLSMERYLGNSAIVKETLNNKNLWNIPDSIYKLELLEMLADVSTDWNDDEIKRCFDELIRLSPNEEKYYIIAANRTINLNQKDYYLRLASDKFCNDPFVLISYARYLYNQRDEKVDNQIRTETLIKAIDLLKKSLTINNTINSDARILLCKCYQAQYVNDTDKRDNLIKGIVDDICIKFPYHPNTLEILQCCNNKKYDKILLNDAIEFYSKADDADAMEDLYIKLISWTEENENKEDVLKKFETFETNYIPSERYFHYKANCMLKYCMFQKAKDCINNVEPSPSSDIIRIKICYYNQEYDEMEKIYLRNKRDVEIVDTYFSFKQDYCMLCDIFKDRKDSGALSNDDLILYSFALLKEKRYEDVVKLLKPYYDNPMFKTGEIIINYLFAKYNNDSSKLKEKIKEKIFNNEDFGKCIYDDRIQMVAFALLQDVQKSISCLKKEISKSPIFFYLIQNWPVMTNVLKSDKYKSFIVNLDFIKDGPSVDITK